MSKDNMGECRRTNTVTVGTQADGECLVFAKQGQHLMGRPTMTVGTQTNESFLSEGNQLLPGILDEITLDHIGTKLPWRALYILSRVSPSWREAIRSRRVHDARVKSHSTETLVVHTHICIEEDSEEDSEVLALYSMRDKCCHELPPIPRRDRGIPYASQCISLDGRIYLLGGATDYGSSNGKKEVYLLDLVSQRQWRQCDSMAKRRVSFASGIVDGKIYVFGGSCNSKPVRGSEVYDPKVNLWSLITPDTNLRAGLKNSRDNHKVATLGQELLLYGGDCESYWDDYKERYSTSMAERYSTLFSEVYNPVKDEWRVIDTFTKKPSGVVFVAKGKLHLMTRTNMYVHDTDKNTWKQLYSNLYDVFEPMKPFKFSLTAPVVEIGEELLVRVFYRNSDPLLQESFFRSIGFGTQNTAIRWQILSSCSGPIGDGIRCIIDM